MPLQHKIEGETRERENDTNTKRDESQNENEGCLLRRLPHALDTMVRLEQLASVCADSIELDLPRPALWHSFQLQLCHHPKVRKSESLKRCTLFAKSEATLCSAMRKSSKHARK